MAAAPAFCLVLGKDGELSLPKWMLGKAVWAAPSQGTAGRVNDKGRS